MPAGATVLPTTRPTGPDTHMGGPMRSANCSGTEAAATRGSRFGGHPNAPAPPSGASASTAARPPDGRRGASPLIPPENVLYLHGLRRGVSSQRSREVPPGALHAVLAALAPVSRASLPALAGAGVGEEDTLLCLRRLVERGYVAESDAPLPSGHAPSYSLTERGRELARRSNPVRRDRAGGASRAFRDLFLCGLLVCCLGALVAAMMAASGIQAWLAATVATLGACTALCLATGVALGSGGRRRA